MKKKAHRQEKHRLRPPNDMWRAALIAFLLPGSALADEFFTLRGHGGPIMGIAVAPDDTIATVSFDNSVGLWRQETPRWLEAHRAAVNVALFGNGSLFTGGDDYAVLQWDTDTGEATELVNHKGKVMGLALSPGGLLAGASWDGSISLVDLASGGVEFLNGHTSGVNAVAFSQDGTLLYSASSDGTVRVWDVATRAQKQLLVKHGFGINELIVTRDWIGYGAVDGGTRIVDPATGNALRDFTLDRRPVLAMAYDPADAALAVGDGEGFIMVIDTDAWRIARDFRATKRGPVWALAFSRDGKNLHAGGIDDIMYSWPIETLGDHERMAQGDRTFLEDPDTLPNGERQFKRKCSICHTLTPDGARRAGPSLYGVFGRRAGEVEGYAYSKTLIDARFAWSEETIDALFDEGPDDYIPGSKMPMQRITRPQDRQDLIAYIKDATAPEGDTK